MIPLRIEGGKTFGKPKSWDETQGKCLGLQVRIVDNRYQSLWEPTPGELKILNEGGRVVLSVFGGQPPVMLSVEEAPK